MPGTCIVVPCFNEAKRLDRAAFLRFVRASADTRFLFVDDGSTDETGEIIGKLCAERPEQLSLLTLEGNRGKAEAVRQGVLSAMAAGTRYAGYWDADLATPLDAIARFRRVLDDAPWLELVMGSRVQLLGRHIERHALRHYLGRVFATTASLVLGLRVYDTQCGAKLFRVTPAMADVFDAPFASRWIFDVELLARMIRQRREGAGLGAEQVIYEEPLTDWVDVGGSKLRAGHFIVAFVDLARIYFGSGRPPGAGAGRALSKADAARSGSGSGAGSTTEEVRDGGVGARVG